MLQIKRIVSEVGIDKTHHSLSFNEFLTLVSNNRRAQPTEANLIDSFGWVKDFYSITAHSFYCLLPIN